MTRKVWLIGFTEPKQAAKKVSYIEIAGSQIMWRTRTNRKENIDVNQNENDRRQKTFLVLNGPSDCYPISLGFMSK